MTQSEQDAFWDAGGLYRPSDHPVVELFARQRIRFLESVGALADVSTMLDVGSGSGFSSRYYGPEMRLVVCDHAAGMIARNPARSRVRCSAFALPFRDGAFDLVNCWELLHHLEAPAVAVREMLRVARRRVVIFEPNRNHPGHLWLALTRDNERGVLRFSGRFLRRVVREAGGEIRVHVRGGQIFPNVTPLPLARLLARLPYHLPVFAISQLVIAEPGWGRPDRHLPS